MTDSPGNMHAKRTDRTVKSPTPLVQPTHRLRPHFLEQNHGSGALKKYELVRDSLVLGREPGVDIVLMSERVSRRHALLRRNGEEYSIIDLDSSHGIYLNTIKVYSAVLRDGDYIQLGDVGFLYHEG